MTNIKIFYANIILPIPVPKLFTYKIPSNLISKVKRGYRVLVPFQKNKIITGIIAYVHNKKPSYNTKEILDVIDNGPTFNSVQILFIEWISKYYMCYLGEVTKAALPSGLKISSESKIQLNPLFNLNDLYNNLSEEEKEILSSISKNKDQSISIKRIEKKQQKSLNKLIDKKVLIIYEQVKDRYIPKIIKKVSLKKEYFDEYKLKELFKELDKSPKQLNVLIEYFKYISMKICPNKENSFINKGYLNKKNVSTSSLNTLLKKQIFIEKEEVISRFEDIKIKSYKNKLNENQKKALIKIYDSFDKNKIALLFGITGSGKTEIYIAAIKEVLKAGGQVLFLMPEIALTTQMVIRIKAIFGNEMNVFHSKYSDNERTEVWNNLKYNKVNFIIGTRSSIFLPFSNLSLIIIDEEHDQSYKQNEPSPRYNARDAAIMLAKFHNAKVLLGSATPSFESYFNAKNSKYSLIELKERFNKTKLPKIHIVDMKKKNKFPENPELVNASVVAIEKNYNKLENLNISKENIYENLKISNSKNPILNKKINLLEFSSELIDEIKNQIKLKKQTLIFQNRRGYAPYIMCECCAWIPYCNQCDVSLTYHQKENFLICHYCNNKSKLPQSCMVCGSNKIKNIGFGTEKLEESLNDILPEAKIKRMDYDTTRGKFAYDKIIQEIKDNKIDIIIGTQMISKGFDFEKIGLVGIIDLDRIIRMPDFRAKEKAFQIATQVSGRAGRRKEQGLVIIQTYDPNDNILKYIKENDYENLFLSEMEERKLFLYCPFIRLIKIILKHKEFNILKKASLNLMNFIDNQNVKQKYDIKILGPQKPIISKIKNLFILNIWIKLGNKDLEFLKHFIKKQTDKLREKTEYKQLSVFFDVDPY